MTRHEHFSSNLSTTLSCVSWPNAEPSERTFFFPVAIKSNPSFIGSYEAFEHSSSLWLQKKTRFACQLDICSPANDSQDSNCEHSFLLPHFATAENISSKTIFFSFFSRQFQAFVMMKPHMLVNGERVKTCFSFVPCFVQFTTQSKSSCDKKSIGFLIDLIKLV